VGIGRKTANETGATRAIVVDNISAGRWLLMVQREEAKSVAEAHNPIAVTEVVAALMEVVGVARGAQAQKQKQRWKRRC